MLQAQIQQIQQQQAQKAEQKAEQAQIAAAVADDKSVNKPSSSNQIDIYI